MAYTLDVLEMISDRGVYETGSKHRKTKHLGQESWKKRPRCQMYLKISGRLPHSDLAADLEGSRRLDAVELAEGIDSRAVVDRNAAESVA